jgi:hypothetical protein
MSNLVGWPNFHGSWREFVCVCVWGGGGGGERRTQCKTHTTKYEGTISHKTRL